MNVDLLPILACPYCRSGNLRLFPLEGDGPRPAARGAGETRAGVISCGGCGRWFCVAEGVPSFVFSADRERLAPHLARWGGELAGRIDPALPADRSLDSALADGEYWARFYRQALERRYFHFLDIRRPLAPLYLQGVVETLPRGKGERGAAEHAPYVHLLLDRLTGDAGALPRGSRVLEVGCGSGWLALELARRGLRPVGLDTGLEGLKLARLYALRRGLGIDYVHGDGGRPPFADGAFAALVGFQALHHIPRLDEAAPRLERLLVPRGLVALFEHRAERPPRLERLSRGLSDRLFLRLAGRVRIHPTFPPHLSANEDCSRHLIDRLLPRFRLLGRRRYFLLLQDLPAFAWFLGGRRRALYVLASRLTRGLDRLAAELFPRLSEHVLFVGRRRDGAGPGDGREGRGGMRSAPGSRGVGTGRPDGTGMPPVPAGERRPHRDLIPVAVSPCGKGIALFLLPLWLLIVPYLSGCRPREEAPPSPAAQERATRGGLLDLLELARLIEPRLGQREEEYRRALEGSAATVRAYEFQAAGEAEGWRAASGCADLRVAGGALRVRAGSSDCQLELPAGLDAAGARRLEVRLRADAGTRGQLFWRGDGEPYSEANSYRFQLLPDGLFHDYTLELGERGEWAGRIAGLRFDPLDAPGSVEIEFFRFLRGLPSRERDLLAARSLIPGASLELGGDRRPAILVPAGGEIVFTLRLPPAAEEERAGEDPSGRSRRGPFLRLASGVVQAAAAPGGPLRLTLRVEAGGEEKLLLDRVLEPSIRPADRGWHNHRLSLARYAGRTVRLTLAASAGGEGRGGAISFAAWANPLIDPGGEGRGGVLLVLVDTLRADRMGLYGHGRRTSPHLDRWSREGITCRQAVSACSWTSPSVASFLTGLLPYRHGVRYVNRLELEGRFQTLAESFAQAGWFTGAFSDSRLIIPANGFGQGFRTFGERPEGAPEWGAALLTRQATAWLRQNGDLPFFLYLHYMDPHGPYTPPPPYHPGPFPGPRGAIGEDAELGRVGGIVARMQREPPYRPSPAERQWLTTLYDGEVAVTDYHLGRLLAWMRQSGLLEGTTVVLLADHGEEFGDRGKYSHATSLHEEQVHVPLLLLPAAGLGLPRGASCPAVVRTVDLPATLLEMAGLPAAAGEGDGRSLLPLLRGGRGQAPEEAYSEMNPYTVGPLSAGWFEPARGLRFGDLKLLYSPREERYRLYDLGADPGEAHDIYREADPRSGEMVERLERHLRAGGAGEEPGAPAFLEENRLRQLEALGYLGP